MNSLLTYYFVFQDRVFDKGEMNTYAEEEILTDLALKYVDVNVVNSLKQEDFRWIYSILIGEMPSNDLQIDSAFSFYNVVHSKIFNDQERKSLGNELTAASRRLGKILERLVHNMSV